MTMNKLLFQLIILLIFSQGSSALAQNIMWQHRYSWVDTDALTDAVSLEDGTVLAAGSAGFSPGIALLRLTEDGDTIYMRGLPLTRGAYYTIRICRLKNGMVFVAVLSPARGGLLGRISPDDGTLIWSLSIPGVGPLSYAPTIYDLSEGPNNTILVAASTADPLGQASNIGYLGCFDTLGIPKWVKEIREHPTNTFCNHVEQTPEGNVFVSGMAGSRIWGAELTADSGREIRRATFYQSSNLIYFDNQNAWAFQAPGQRYLVSGMIRSTTPSYYLGLHQGWAGPKIWGGEKQQGNTRKPVVNSDGSIVYVNEWSTASRMIRLRADSTIRWSIPKPRPTGSNGTAFYAYASLEDSSAIGVGIIAYPDSTDWDWYAARITNMGIPYDPSPVVSVVKSLEVRPYVYPTPCAGSLGFSGLRSPAKLELVDMQGRTVLITDVAPEQMADVSALVPGLYQYRVSCAGRVYSGRVMKE
ncbi:T9SS type A sorting domain-containing protein [Nostoc sp. NIES-2111]